MAQDTATDPEVGERWGVERIVSALGLPGTRARVAKLALPFLFGGTMTAIAYGEAAFEYAAQLPTWAVSAAVWALWSVWHSVVMPRNRLRLMAAHGEWAYRRAFWWDVFPGVCVGFSQMLRPMGNGEVYARFEAQGRSLVAILSPDPRFVIGGFCVSALAATWHLRQMKTLGVARAAFVNEYQLGLGGPAEGAATIVESGAYRMMRHPLFWSGVVYGWGLALISNTPAGFGAAVVNTLYGFVYNVLEDRRLARIFGNSYQSYADRVPPVPWRRRRG